MLYTISVKVLLSVFIVTRYSGWYIEIRQHSYWAFYVHTDCYAQIQKGYFCLYPFNIDLADAMDKCKKGISVCTHLT